ncbi:MAG: ComF family protein, partial [Dehalococcoidia bacterium]|nr:ComF family protein [Dehalococcoidia bacterium]
EVIDFFFPRECIECGKIGDFICIECLKKLPRLLPPLCPRCGKPESSGSFCHECWKTSCSLERVRSVFIFDGIVRKAVHSLKYHNLRAIAGCLGDYMAGYYLENNMTGDVLVPVPLYDKRLQARGYNQSALLAKEMSRIVKMPVEEYMVKRTRDTSPQARTKNVEERRLNMEKAFCSIGANMLGKDIIVIDDVCTSGATLEACASVLRAAGARSVTGFTLAREINKQE